MMETLSESCCWQSEIDTCEKSACGGLHTSLNSCIAANTRSREAAMVAIISYCSVVSVLRMTESNRGLLWNESAANAKKWCSNFRASRQNFRSGACHAGNIENQFKFKGLRNML